MLVAGDRREKKLVGLAAWSLLCVHAVAAAPAAAQGSVVEVRRGDSPARSDRMQGAATKAMPGASPTAGGSPRLTLDRLYSLPHLIGNRPTGFAWSKNGRSLAFLWNDAGGNFRDVWVVDVGDPQLEPRRVTRMPRLEPEIPDDAGALAAARAAERIERDPGVLEVLWHPDGKRLLLTFRGDLWLIDPAVTGARLGADDDDGASAAGGGSGAGSAGRPGLNDGAAGLESDGAARPADTIAGPRPAAARAALASAAMSPGGLTQPVNTLAEQRPPRPRRPARPRAATEAPRIRQLTATAAPESQPAFSPDGEVLAFLKKGDVWTIPIDAATGRRGTAVAVRRSRVARPDVAVRSFHWAPDSRRFAVLEADESGLPLRSIPDYLAPEPVMVRVRRAYPGDEPMRYRLGLVEAGREDSDAPFQASVPGPSDAAWIDLATSGDRQPDMILGYAWSPDGRHLAADTSDLYAKDRRVLIVDVDAAGAASPARLAARDLDPENETFYFWRIAWSTSSRLLYFLSDREDDYHVWAVAPGGGPARRLTSGPWAVAEMHPIGGGLLVVGNRGRAEERQLFLVSDRGGEVARVSQRPGTHSPTVSPDGRWAAVAFSNDATPPELLLTRLDAPAGETDERRVTRSPVEEFSSYRWVQPAYVSFPSHVDGTTLHGRLTLPPDFDPSRGYPAILGSVYTDSVRNQWGGRTAHPTWGLDQYLAQQGYVLLNVDMRGSWGRGRQHRRGIRLDYGGMDIEDLESGVRFLGTLGYVDLERVGIWGSSYGGLMTTMSLFRKPGLYAAGVAGAPATNVRHALTGQMAVMMHPEDQPDEYDDSSPFLHVQGLEDPLMIIHGMRDRVVLFKDSVVLVHRLILLDKDVDLVALPDAGHGWDNEGLAQTRFAFKKLVEHFDRHLKGTD